MTKKGGYYKGVSSGFEMTEGNEKCSGYMESSSVSWGNTGRLFSMHSKGNNQRTCSN
jgi:hypothetical protein